MSAPPDNIETLAFTPVVDRLTQVRANVYNISTEGLLRYNSIVNQSGWDLSDWVGKGRASVTDLSSSSVNNTVTFNFTLDRNGFTTWVRLEYINKSTQGDVPTSWAGSSKTSWVQYTSDGAKSIVETLTGFTDFSWVRLNVYNACNNGSANYDWTNPDELAYTTVQLSTPTSLNGGGDAFANTANCNFLHTDKANTTTYSYEIFEGTDTTLFVTGSFTASSLTGSGNPYYANFTISSFFGGSSQSYWIRIRANSTNPTYTSSAWTAKDQFDVT